MAEISVEPRHALAGLPLPMAAPRVTISAASPAARFVVRGTPPPLPVGVGLPWPHEPCRAVEAEGRAALWLGPDEWLLLVPPAEAAATAATLAHACAGRGYCIDITHRQFGLRIEGHAAEALLSAAIPLDLDSSAFPVGMCARTIFEKVEVVLWRQAAVTFRLEAWRSFAPYVVGLLGAALRDVTSRDIKSNETASLDGA